MDVQHHDIPFPRPVSLVLLVATVGFNILHKETHITINAWIATIAGIMSVTHYSISFYNLYKKRKAHKHPKK